MAVTGADKSSLADSHQSLAHAFPQSSRSPTGFPQRFSGRFRGNNTPKLFNKHRHYLRAHGPMSALPPKADMDQHGCDVRFVPKADISSVWKVTALGR